MFHLTSITDQHVWDKTVSSCVYAQFTQSWMWGEFQRSQGRDVRRFFLEDIQGKPFVAMQLIRFVRHGFGYWFAPRGPVFFDRSVDGLVSSDAPLIRELFETCLQGLSKEHLPGLNVFHRFEPCVSLEQGIDMMPLSMRRQHSMNPASARLIDLAPSLEALQREMHEKTRYNIRVAERKGVMVRIGEGEQDEATFLELTKETAKRDGFVSHSDAYLLATYRYLQAQGQAQLRFAEVDGKVLAASMEILFGDTVTYLHGASSSTNRDCMAPYALHWSAIQAARANGLRWYDLGGMNPNARSSYYYKTGWEGISRFKAGWGGRTIDLIGTWDLPVHAWMYRLVFLKGSWRG